MAQRFLEGLDGIAAHIEERICASFSRHQVFSYAKRIRDPLPLFHVGTGDRARVAADPAELDEWIAREFRQAILRLVAKR